METITGLFLHGIGTQGHTYAERAQTELRQALQPHGYHLVSAVAHWAPVLDQLERKLYAAVLAKGAADKPMRRLAVEVLADALSYRDDRPLYRAVHAVVGHAVDKLRHHRGRPLFVFAHSLGGMIFLDYMRSTRAQFEGHTFEDMEQLFTFGCNVPLFTLGKRFERPQRTVARWTNFWDEDDFLGYPLAVLPEFADVIDIQVNVGGLLTWWNGFSHVEYWDDRAFWRRHVADRVVHQMRLRKAA